MKKKYDYSKETQSNEINRNIVTYLLFGTLHDNRIGPEDTLQRMCRLKNIATTRKMLFRKLLFSCSVASNSLWPRGLQHSRFPCPSPSPGACSDSSPTCPWCHPALSSCHSFSSCLRSFPASGSFLTSLLFTSGGQSIGLFYSVEMFRILNHGDSISVAQRKLLQGGRRGGQAVYKFATKGAGSLNIKGQVSS